MKQAARYYGAGGEIFLGMGHVMMLEADWQKVADRVSGWMRVEELDRA